MKIRIYPVSLSETETVCNNNNNKYFNAEETVSRDTVNESIQRLWQSSNNDIIITIHASIE